MIRLTGYSCYTQIDTVLVESLIQKGILDSSDLGFAAYALNDFSDDLAVFYAAIALVWAARNQHVCIDCENTGLLFVSDNPDDTDSARLRQIVTEILHVQSESSDGPFFSRISDPRIHALTPAVFYGHCLYLNRYFYYQQKIAKEIYLRLEKLPVREDLLEKGLTVLYPPGTDQVQRRAAVAGVRAACTVISGGPGTGKTTTVIKIALLHIQQLRAQEKTPRIVLCAPTGKAALRLYHSLSSASAGFIDDKIYSPLLKWLPDSERTLTIHRLISLLKDYEPSLVIVDESSMVDVLLLYRLMSSLPSHSAVIFLGDRDQLSSVQSGSVMADLCTISKNCPEYEDRVCVLEKSYRFTTQSGIGRAAALVRDGDAEGFLDFIKSGDEQLHFINTGDLEYQDALRKAIEAMALSTAEFGAYCRCDDDSEAIALFDRFRILCARRHGIWGVEGLNEAVEKMLGDEGFVAPQGLHYHNMPMLVMKNDYRRNLFNGDTGLIRHNNGLLRFVSINDGELRCFNPLFLAHTQKVFAMTIHKSQGSEYDATLTVLPPDDSPLLTRELLYTAITRSKKRAVILASETSIITCITRPTERMSGLPDLLSLKGKLCE